ncbi:MAG: pyrroloquinoline quinone biosynthesis protein PqqE [Nitrospira sp.]
MERPYTLIAELTYRCQLSCAYCSNPVRYQAGTPLETGEWMRVMEQAEELGVVQINLTGGEPLLRDDLETLIAKARALDLYVNLITSGIPLDRDRLMKLCKSGLGSIQLSIQSADPQLCNRLAGSPVYEHKLEVAEWIRESNIPLTLNVVLHRENLDEIEDIVTLAVGLEAERLELANTQYLGWALSNRDALMPTAQAIAGARERAYAARARLSHAMDIVFVTPDYYADVPRACMDGWGRRYIVITPEGFVLPCHAAHTIEGLPLERVTERPLRSIWEESALFNRFRGVAWMPEPCRTCDRRMIDFGGCRCQAFHLTGMASATDPACHLSPDHALVVQAQHKAASNEPGLLQPRLLRRVP